MNKSPEKLNELEAYRIDEAKLRSLSDEEFVAYQKQRLISLHGLSEEEATRVIERQERLANIFFDQWLMKINKIA